MRKMIISLAAAAMCSSTAFAGGGECAAKSSCSNASAQAIAACDKSDSKAMAAQLKKIGVPMMEIHVGDETTCCPLEAQEMASKNGTQAEFIVAGVTYNNPADAGEAWSHQLADYLDTMTRVRFAVGDDCTSCPMAADSMCEKSGKKVAYRVGNTTFKNADEAIRAAAAANAMAKQVAYQYEIDDERCACSAKASKAKAKGKHVKYVVGDMAVDCPVQASCMLNIAKIQTAIQAADSVSHS